MNEDRMIWQENDAAERFDELLAATLNEGEQTISRAGVEVAVFASFDDWNNLKSRALNPEGKPASQSKS
jgi:prevent-host-death family protein